MDDLYKLSDKVESVAAYIRVSTSEQHLRGISLPAQRMKLEEYAKANNLRIVEWYADEGVTGRKLIAKRPELQRMIRDAEAKKFTRILFVKLDRFFRSVAEYHECMKRIEPCVWTATEEKYDLSTASGRMFVNMKLTVAEMEADTGSERILLVNDYKIANSQWLSGNCTFGFVYTEDEHGRRRVLKDPATQGIVMDILNHVMRHQSIRATMRWLKEEYDIDMHYSTLSRWLKKPLLYGAYRGNTEFCEPYLSKEEWEKMQNAIRRNVRVHDENRHYWFSGLIRCPQCGHLLKGGVYTGKRKSGGHYEYKQYRCQHAYLSAGRCTFKTAVFENTLERELLKDIEKLLDQAEAKNVKILEKNKKTVKPDVEKLNTQIDRLNYAWMTGKIRSEEQYETMYKDLNRQLHEALVGEEKTEEARDLTHVRGRLEGGWKEIYAALDDEHKRSFWRSIIESIEIDWEGNEKRVREITFF